MLTELYGKGRIGEIIASRKKNSDSTEKRMLAAKAVHDKAHRNEMRARNVKDKMEKRKTAKPDDPYYNWSRYKGKVS